MIRLNKNEHDFHLVDVSPWPFSAATLALMLTIGGVLTMHCYKIGSFLLLFGFLMILFVMFVWWRDIAREGTYEGQHTKTVPNDLKICVLLCLFFYISLSNCLCEGLEGTNGKQEILENKIISCSLFIISLSTYMMWTHVPGVFLIIALKYARKEVLDSGMLEKVWSGSHFTTYPTDASAFVEEGTAMLKFAFQTKNWTDNPIFINHAATFYLHDINSLVLTKIAAGYSLLINVNTLQSGLIGTKFFVFAEFGLFV